MRLPRRLTPRLFRHVVAVAALLAQLVAATGAPLPSHNPSATAKKSAVPFPCQDHPCGCGTSEQGWAGDCCCFTLEQKLAWADARGVTPPPHVRPTVESRKAAPKAEKSCCAKKTAPSCHDRADAPSSDEPERGRVAKLGVRWVAGVFAQKCRGEGFGGLLKLELIVAPDAQPAPRAAYDPTESIPAIDSRAVLTSLFPPTPPPRTA